MSNGGEKEPGPEELAALHLLEETLGRMPDGAEILAELQRRAMAASSPEEFVNEIFGGEDVVRDLLDETGGWSLEQHEARIAEIKAEANGLDEERVEDVGRIVDLAYGQEFHEQAVQLLRDRGLATLARAGDAEATVAELMRRLREADGVYAPADLSHDPFED